MLHVAVLLKPYLDLILAGTKTVECRLTQQALAPYEQIERGERIYFKQSSGPYRATAIAGEVLFERDLSPQRVREIKRDYNELIHGAAEFWRIKRNSRYLTLIWLTDVQPIERGPEIPPLQGRAWVVLSDDAAQQQSNRETNRESFTIQITEGNLRNSTIYVTSVMDRFPSWSIGGATRQQAARPITLMLQDGPTMQTDIVGPRKLLRSRAWGAWFKQHGVAPGDRIVFTPIDEATYFVGLVRTS
jgi:ASC-1-like (ASCH) protein